MRFLLIALFIFCVHVNADEMQRIESIVVDIKKLRLDYDKSQEDLALTQVQLKDEKDKNEILLRELESKENEIIILNNQIKNIKKSEISSQKDKVIIKEKTIICQDNQISNKNKFPLLQMKKQEVSTALVSTKAQTYRLNKNANIYNGIDGKVIDIWEERTSFTSNFKSGSWIKITGYFVEKVWQKSKQELWIKEIDANHR